MFHIGKHLLSSFHGICFRNQQHMDYLSQDWEYLLSSDHHRYFSTSHDCYLGFDSSVEEQALLAARSTPEPVIVDTTAPLFSHIATVLYALHLVYEVPLLFGVLSCKPFHV